MYWMLMPLRRYAEFHGRSRRMEYWMWYLFNLLIGAFVGVLFILTYAMGLSETAMTTVLTPVILLYALAALAFVIPGLAVTIRRLHDTDRSGWAILFGLIPIVGGFILLYFMVSRGTDGPNRFGPDPLQDERPGPMAAPAVA